MAMIQADKTTVERGGEGVCVGNSDAVYKHL